MYANSVKINGLRTLLHTLHTHSPQKLMASWTLFSPPSSPITLPISFAAKTTTASNNKCYCFRRSSGGEKKRAITRITTKATEDGESSSSSGSKDEETPGFNPFGFVNNNPSSRSAIQLPDLPADDGNVGQMISVCHCFDSSLQFWQCC